VVGFDPDFLVGLEDCGGEEVGQEVVGGDGEWEGGFEDHLAR
jgi:hypothetical protein